MISIASSLTSSLTSSLAPIAFWLLAGVLGIALLCVWCWRWSVREWRPPTNDVAPGVKLPTSLHELRARHRR